MMPRVLLLSFILHSITILFLIKLDQKSTLRDKPEKSTQAVKIKLSKHSLTKKTKVNNLQRELRKNKIRRAKRQLPPSKTYSSLITQSRSFLTRQSASNYKQSSGTQQLYGSRQKGLKDDLLLQVSLPPYAYSLPQYSKTTLSYIKCADGRWVFKRFEGDRVLARHVTERIKSSVFFETDFKGFFKGKKNFQLDYIIERTESTTEPKHSFTHRYKNYYSLHYILPQEKESLVMAVEGNQSNVKGGAIDIMGLVLKAEEFVNGKKEDPRITRVRKQKIEKEFCQQP